MTMITQLPEAKTAALVGSGTKAGPIWAFAGYQWLCGVFKVLCCLIVICGGLCLARTAEAQDEKKGAGTANQFLEQGVDLLKKRDPAGAMGPLTKATELDPKNWRAFYNLGLAYHFMSASVGKRPESRKETPARAEYLKKAEDNYLKSLKLNDTNVKAYRNLGMIAVYRKDFKAAAEFFKQGKKKCADTAPAKALDRLDEYYQIAQAVQHRSISAIMGIDFGMSLQEFRREARELDEIEDKFHPYLTMVHFTVNNPDLDKHVVAWFLTDRAFSPLVGMFYSITKPPGQDPLVLLKLRYPKVTSVGARSVDRSGDSGEQGESDFQWKGDRTMALSRFQVFEASSSGSSKQVQQIERVLVAEVDKELAEVVEKRVKRRGVARDLLKYILDTSYEMGKAGLDYDIKRLQEKSGGKPKTKKK